MACYADGWRPRWISDEAADHIFLKRQSRTVQLGRVTIDGEIYEHDALLGLPKSQRVDCRFNPLERDVILVYLDEKFLCPAHPVEYSSMKNEDLAKKKIVEKRAKRKAIADNFRAIIKGIPDLREYSKIPEAEKVAAAGLLISSVAHELSNPLTAVSGHAQLLQHRSWPDGLKETFEQIHINANRCSRVVQNMLFFVRASKGDRKPLMLNEVVESSLELLQYRFVKIDGVEVVRELEAGLPKALGDYQQLSQVLVNLINNACDAMQAIERGSGKRRIVLRTRREGARAVVEVEDAGTGVPEELFGRVFEAFVTTKPSGKGTGLGLYICKQIMAGHGGSISFYNRENGGAVFALELPLADGAAVVREEVVVEAPAVPGKRVLVVDDEEGAARVICATLADEGDEVVAVGSGSEALRELEKGADLVVSDIEMEGVNGYELFKRMREGGSKVPVLFVTGNILEQGVLDFLVRVEAAYMVKPFRVEGLRRAVRRMLAGERLRGLQK